MEKVRADMAGDEEVFASLIRQKAERVDHLSGEKILVIKDHSALEISKATGRNLHEIYGAALTQGICPNRYLRNLYALSIEEQLSLARSRVAVIGAGGLGGQVILLLARTGVGHLVVVDSDVFDETNLNRQALSTVQDLERPKAQIAADTVARVNPGVRVTPHRVRLEASNANDILSGSDVVVDALDNVGDRFLLEKAAKGLGIPLVHGAVAGFEGHLMTILPGDAGMSLLYGTRDPVPAPEKTPEALLGVLAPTAALIATLQGMEVLKLLLKRGRIIRNQMAHVDLEGGELKQFSFDRQE